MKNELTKDVPAVLLVGGLGTRLRSVVQQTPKPLANVGGQPFLELLVRQLAQAGIHRLVMCTGFLGDQIYDRFGDGRAWGVAIKYSRESVPLGTAGAIKLAEPYLAGSSEFLVMNGDSFVEVDLVSLLRSHRCRAALVSMAVVQVEDAGRYGTVQTTADGRVIGFEEKTGSTTRGVVNAGVYVFDREILTHIPTGPGSLEKDVFPKILKHGVYVQEERGMFIDIGVPEEFARAQGLSRSIRNAVLGRGTNKG